MKIKMLQRHPDDIMRETKHDIHKVPRNYDPSLHPFQAPREYQRALNATKLERVFAKPFLGSLDGHSDGVYCLAKHPTKLSWIVSGAYDGEIRQWNVVKKRRARSITAHETYVRGLSFHPNGNYYFSCGDDKTVKQWRFGTSDDTDDEPMNTILGKYSFHGISHHHKDNVFATCGQQVDIWDESRSEPMRSFSWGIDSINYCSFNPVETYVLGAAASDRSLLLYDMRGAAPLKKVILRLRSNAIAWNPMEAFMFTAANEDYNLYTFDMRKLDMPLNVHMDHVSAVMDVDYSPTGKAFVSGGYDKTIRVFDTSKGRSREVYHTKRMQRVTCVRWTLDDRFLLSGSDEMNIRLWKARASEKLGTLRPREREAHEYQERLKQKFAHHPHVRRIARHRHVPRSIYTAGHELRVIRAAQKRKEDNRRKHSKPGTVPRVPERKKHVVKVVS